MAWVRTRVSAVICHRITAMSHGTVSRTTIWGQSKPLTNLCGKWSLCNCQSNTANYFFIINNGR
jgi:hypothetical protein